MDFKNIEEFRPDDKDGEPKFHFYYNREERLKNAPQNVRDLYEGKMNPKKGLFKVIFQSSGNRFMFFSIIVFAAVIWIYSFFSSRGEKEFLGTECSLEAFSYADEIYATFEMKALQNGRKSDSIQIPVSVVFYVYDSSGIVADKKEENDLYTGEELFIRTKFHDYDIIKIVASVSAGTEAKDFEVKIQKR